jgi:outer membrane protein assembly factor BamB
MKFAKNKIVTVVIALFLFSTVLGVMTTVPTSKAQTAASPIPTNAYASVSPNPAQVNQPVTVLMWLVQFEPTAAPAAGGRWENFTLLVTAPDGTTETFGPFTADAASCKNVVFTPTQVGTYTLKFSFPGQHVTGMSLFGFPVDSYYGASSYTATFTVQQEGQKSMPEAPLPTNYWTRPINSQNSQWYTISGNWWGLTPNGFGASANTINGDINLYTTGPDSAHILWTKSLEIGGLIGGEFGGTTTSGYYTGKSYEHAFGPPVVINGILYYNNPGNIQPTGGFCAVDLRTGETLWTQDNGTITLGQVYNYMSPNQEGGIPYLWDMSGRIWTVIDANTGKPILQIANATSGTNYLGPNGELLVYGLGTTWVSMWNASLCIQKASDKVTGNPWEWRPPTAGAVLDFNTGIQWNATVPSIPGQTISKIDSGIILATTANFLMTAPSQLDVAYSATTGQQLWVQNRTYPSGPSTSFGYQMGAMGEGVFTEYDALSMQWYGFNATTGEKLWGPTAPDPDPWGSQPCPGMVPIIANGIFYGGAADGIHAFNLTTGEKLWDFSGINSGLDFPGFTYYPFEGSAMTYADGKIYVGTGITHGVPMFRGAQLYCINATTGTLLWRANGMYLIVLPIADGILVDDNWYDSQIYAFGKGPSETTVTAATPLIAQGSQVLLTGTVIDISAGTQQDAVAANFPHGLPAVSDESQTQFMEAVYMQQQMPNNVTGVPVHLTAIDPNGNFQDLGTVTSSADGTYAISWTPPVPGLYHVTATFEGSNSYYSSSDATYFTASEAAAAAPASSANPQVPAETSLPAVSPTPAQSVSLLPSEVPQPATTAATPTLTYIAIGAAVIVIVAVAAVLIFRRRK